ncbi:hypothetical protein X741_32475 [Mesorhizobium sp. LNHC229A00]|nr:hypothetical protein X741_32475 [Mesorhizobium sp. LNHC229A00]
MWTLHKLFDQYPRQRLPFMLPAQQVGCMSGYLIEVPAQSDTDAAAADGWLENHWKADRRSRAFNVPRVRCQAISRYWNVGLREELTLSEFVAASFNRYGIRARQIEIPAELANGRIDPLLRAYNASNVMGGTQPGTFADQSIEIACIDTDCLTSCCTKVVVSWVS